LALSVFSNIYIEILNSGRGFSFTYPKLAQGCPNHRTALPSQATPTGMLAALFEFSIVEN
jgi:hypothetical protein